MASTKLMPINTSAEYDRRTEAPAKWTIPCFTMRHTQIGVTLQPGTSGSNASARIPPANL
jgi:hypothetical protein